MRRRADIQAGEAAQKSRWDLRRLVPTHIKDPMQRSAFWREALAHSKITGVEEDIAFQLLNGNSIRKVSKMLGLHRQAILKIVRKIYQAVQDLIEANRQWTENFKPGDRKEIAFVVNRNRRKIEAAREPHLYENDADLNTS